MTYDIGNPGPGLGQARKNMAVLSHLMRSQTSLITEALTTNLPDN
jgi:hypothetical protein